METALTTEPFSEEFSMLADLPANKAEAGVYVKNLFTMLEEFAVTYGGRLVVALIILVVGFKLIHMLARRIENAKLLEKTDPSARGFFLGVVGGVAKTVVGITALAVMGVPMSSIVAVIGSCGLAIGLALQGSLANIAGGFILLVFKPFAVGDYIVTEKAEGTVAEIGIFYTKLLTLDHKRVTIPNAEVSNQTLVNTTAEGKRRVDVTFSASYADDSDRVERTLLDVCAANPLILQDPAPFARLSAHKDSALEYTVRAWCRAEDYWTVFFDLQRDVRHAFDKNGITIPFPQVDVHTDPSETRRADFVENAENKAD